MSLIQKLVEENKERIVEAWNEHLSRNYAADRVGLQQSAGHKGPASLTQNTNQYTSQLLSPFCLSILLHTSASNYILTALVTERDVFAQSVMFTEDAMTLFLDDGRSVSVPLTWYPRLMAGSPEERERYEFIGDGEGIHWPDLDEDISVEGILAGRRSAESDTSLSRWLERRRQ